jgi:xanthine/CO dehydrogenase XdhC/CoxF family maturation factor
MLFPAGAPSLGLVSGGCLEADLARRAAEVLDSGDAQTVVYDMRSPDDIVWGLGLGCDGEVRVLLERLVPGRPPDYLRLLGDWSQQRRRGVLATLFEVAGVPGLRPGDRLMVDRGGVLLATVADAGLSKAIESDARVLLAEERSASTSYELPFGRAEVCFESIGPTPALVLFGAGEDVVPMVRLARELGWNVTVADHRPALVRAERFPTANELVEVDYARLSDGRIRLDEATVVLVMTHHFLHDLALMRFLLPSAAPYLGFLGPRRRLEHLLVELGRQGVLPTAEQATRLYGPAGLDIGSETPEEIALSVLAEMQAVLGQRMGGFLRERRAPLH